MERFIVKRVLILTLLITQFACADNLTFHGKLINPPACTINNGETLEVSFGSVIIDNIDGVNYLTEIPWTLTCDSSFRDDALTFTLSYLGTATPYSAKALTTNVPELGIELQQNGTVFPPSTSLTIDESSLPTLKAVPVKQPGKEPAEGDFEAFATLQVDYQ